ncbi:mono/diheme cytochrome c family protein [Bradyrhizobium sp. LM3.4]
MLRRTISVALLAALAAAGVYWWLSAPVVAAAGGAPAHVPDLANGEVMFNAGGCASCHAVPDQPDRLRLGGGVAIKSPFGTFYAPNISSDPIYGIGKWSDAEFVNAVMHGVSPDGQHYFPASFPTRPISMPGARTCSISSPI